MAQQNFNLANYRRFIYDLIRNLTGGQVTGTKSAAISMEPSVFS